MMRRTRGRVCMGLLLAGSAAWVSGCGDSASNVEAQVTITSVDGDGNAPNEIETMIIVRGTNFEVNDKIEVRDAETGVPKTDGTSGTTFVDDTELQLGVDPAAFLTGETKTIVSRQGVPKAIKAVTYLSGPTYIPGPGIDVAAGDIIQTKLSATDGLANDLGAGDELGIAVGGVDATHLGQMGATDGQILTWNDGAGTWETSDLGAIAEVDTLQSVYVRGNTIADAVEGGEVLDVTNTGTTDGSIAVSGYASGVSGVTYGVVGQSDSNAGYGVYAIGGNVGLYATGTNKAAEFSGQVDVTGNLNVTGTITGDGSGLTGVVKSVVAGAGIAVDNTVPADPIVGLVDGVAADQILKWDGFTWGLAVDEVGAGGGQVDSIVAGGGIVVDSADPVNPTVSLIDGAAADDILRWDGSTWQLSTEIDTLQTVTARGGQVLLASAGGDVVDVRNTSSTSGSVAIRGNATASSGITYGVYGQNNSTAGYGLFAQSNNVGLYATGANKAAEFAGPVDVTGNVDVVGTITGDGLTIDGAVGGTGFSGWDTDDTDDLTTATTFGGDLSGTYDTIAVADDSHSHTDATVSDNISIRNTRLYAPAGAGNVGIRTTSPSYALSFTGDISTTVIGKERRATADYNGLPLTILAGGSGAGQVDKRGGDLQLQSGIATGSQSSNIRLYTATAGFPGAGDRIPTEKMTILGNGNVGIGTTGPGARLDVVGGSIRTNNQFISTAPAGTAPLQVNSATTVTNLNADMVDGSHASAFAPVSHSHPPIAGTVVSSGFVNFEVGIGNWLQLAFGVLNQSNRYTHLSATGYNGNFSVTYRDAFADVNGDFVITTLLATTALVTNYGEIRTDATAGRIILYNNSAGTIYYRALIND